MGRNEGEGRPMEARCQEEGERDAAPCREALDALLGLPLRRDGKPSRAPEGVRCAVPGLEPRMSETQHDEELHALGVLRVPAVREHKACAIDLATGQFDCSHERPAGPPYHDCRQPFCPHARVMRTRLLARVARKYAPGERKNGVQS